MGKLRTRPAPGALRAAIREAEVVDLSHDGRGVARLDGKVMLIADALPGERVRFRTTATGRDVDEGQIVEVIEASPSRVTPGCGHFGLCGGCVLQHCSPEAQLQFKQAQLASALRRIGKVEPESFAEPIDSAPWGYRRRARLGVKWLPKRGMAVIGFRQRATHHLASLQVCPVLDPRIGALLEPLAVLVGALSVRDRIPQIEVAAAQRVALVFRVLQSPDDGDRQQLSAFAQRHAVEVLLQPGGPDSIVSLVGGGDPLAYSPDGGPDLLEFEPTDFIQVNGDVAQRVVRQAVDWLAPRPGESVLELFCGLGNFSLPLARRGAQLTAVEGDAGLVARARDNAERLGLDIRFLKADLFRPDARDVWARDRYDAVLLDPPRAGAAEALPLFAASGARRIVYVSCHPGTLARDAGQLVQAHGYRVVRAGIMNMFPQTAHVESMALFER